MDKTYELILNTVLASPWAMERDSFSRILTMLQGEKLTAEDYELFHKASKEAKESIRAEAGDEVEGLANTFIAGNVGVIQIDGPMIAKATMFSDISGVADYGQIGASIASLNENSDVNSILLVMDTPGGSVTGVSELGAMIKNSPKPVDSYVYGNMASAGYWLGSQSRKIYSSPTGMIGSIGVVAGMSVAEEDENHIEIVSTQSPFKREDITSDAGRADAQETIDDLADVFIETVALGRSVSKEKVLSSFGQGRMKIASKALAVGMIDSIQPLSALLLKLNKPVADTMPATFNMEGHTMEDEVDVIETPVAGAQEAPVPETPIVPEVDALALATANIKAIEDLGKLFANSSPATIKAVKDCIDEQKFTAGATKESVSAVLLGVVAGLGKEDGITSVAEDAQALGESLPNPAGQTLVAKTEQELKAEARKAELDSALIEYNKGAK